MPTASTCCALENNRVYFDNIQGSFVMLKWALIFGLISLCAGVLGFTGVAAGAATIAKVLFFVFLALCVLFLAIGLFVINRVT